MKRRRTKSLRLSCRIARTVSRGDRGIPWIAAALVPGDRASPLRDMQQPVVVRDLARGQLNDRDNPASLLGSLTEVGVLRIDTFSETPQALPLSFVFNFFGTEGQASKDH